MSVCAHRLAHANADKFELFAKRKIEMRLLPNTADPLKNTRQMAVLSTRSKENPGRRKSMGTSKELDVQA